MKSKEIYWLLGTFIFCLLIHFSLDGFNNIFTSDSALDINIHDTYFVIVNFHFFILLTTVIFFGVYLIRILHRNFKNIIANVIFIVSNVLLILIFTRLILLTESFMQTDNFNGEILEQSRKEFSTLSKALQVIQILLLILLIFSGIKTGLNYNQTL